VHLLLPENSTTLSALSSCFPLPVRRVLALPIVMAEAKAGSLSFLTDNAITATLADSYAAFSEQRKALKLTNPGTVDNIAREIQKDVLCSNFMFQGLRADFQKVFSLSPLFRIQHGFQMGPNVPSPYNLMALYGTSKVRKS
jgi:mitochondrial import receptor subunit TOM40